MDDIETKLAGYRVTQGPTGLPITLAPVLDAPADYGVDNLWAAANADPTGGDGDAQGIADASESAGEASLAPVICIADYRRASGRAAD